MIEERFQRREMTLSRSKIGKASEMQPLVNSLVSRFYMYSTSLESLVI